MGDWIESSLSEAIAILQSGTRPKGGVTTESGDVPSLGGENIIQSGGVSLRVVKKVPLSFYERMTKGHLKDGDVLINKDGANTGKLGIFKGFNLEKACINEHLFLIRGNEKIDNAFLYYFLLLEQTQQIIKNKISGSAQPGLNSGFIKNFPFKHPANKQEQSTIATILTTIDQAIEKTEQLIAKYERIKTGLMQDLLTRGIDEQGNIRSEETHEFKDSVLGRIPKEWDVVNIGSISEYIGSGVTPKGGSSVYQSSGIMLIRSQNVYPDGFKLEDIAFISEEINNTMLRSEVHEYDVLLNITGASIGRCTYIPENFPKANVNQHVCAIRLIGKKHSKAVFLSDFLNSESGQNQIFKYNAGSNREGLNYSQIRGIELRLPQEEDEIERISSILMAYTETLYSLKSEYAKYFALKKALMQDLLTGKVRVDALTNKLNSLNES